MIIAYMDSWQEGEDCCCLAPIFTYIMSMAKWKMLKTKCLEQHNLFIKWDQHKNYSMFHRSHYDWWAFPIDQLSSHGDKFKVGPNEKDALKNDIEFVNALRGNAILVCRSWGFDLEAGKEVSIKTVDQKWQQWPIRLYKLTNSLELFHQEDLLVNAVQFGNKLIGQGHKFSYNRKRLDEYFIAKDKSIVSSGKEEKKQKQKIEAKHQEVEEKKNIEKIESSKQVKLQKEQIEHKVQITENTNQATFKQLNLQKQQNHKPSTKGAL